MTAKTPLYDEHLKLEGKMVPFAGYLLPMYYRQTGLLKEHLAVRDQAGLFDVSHMGDFVLKGKDALANLQYLFTNGFKTLALGQVRYTLICQDDGGIIDDVLVYHCDEDCYLIVVNAANRQKDYDWLKRHLFGEVELEDRSDEIAQLALQGPKAKDILTKLVPEAALPQKYYRFEKDVEVGGVKCLVSRTGYTGEFGYELYCDAEDTVKLWQVLMTAGQEVGLVPCGLGARDTLRLEAGMPLYGHEITAQITPLEAGLDFAVKLEKEDFIGKKALRETPVNRERIGLMLLDRGVLRENVPIYFEDELIGQTTSGTYCPSVEASCAMALIEKGSAAVEQLVEVEIKGKRLSARVTALPFIKK